MVIPEWINFLFDVEVERANLNLLKEEFIEMTFKLEAKSMYTFKGIRYYWINEKTNKISPRSMQMLNLFYKLFKVYIW